VGVYKTQNYVLKQKSVVQMRITFKVHNDIVQGLKLCTVVKKAGFTVEKGEEVLGSFAPVPSKEFVVDLPEEETPGGYLARGEYKGKAMFIDNEGIVHTQFDYNFNIKKQWE
jgi:Rho GDP-dissociation inhibitor